MTTTTQGSTEPAAAHHGRGLQWLAHPHVSGTIVGAVGATVFVLVNRGQLPDPWPGLALAAWVLALGAYVWTVFLRVRPEPAPAEAASGAWAVYWGAVLGMVALIAGGTALLRTAGVPEAQPALIVSAVGLHFLPFAWAFRAPVFRRLGLTMVGIGVLGVLGAALVDPVASSAACVVAGLAMLALISEDAVRLSRTR